MIRSLLPSAHRVRFAALVTVTGTLMIGTIAGCSGDSDSASTTTTTTDGATGDLATICSEVDLAPITKSAADLKQAEVTLRAAAGNEAEFASATVAFLGKGQIFFSSMATALDPFFAGLAEESGQSAIANVTDAFRSAAEDFAALAPEIESAGRVTSADITEIQSESAKFVKFAEYVNPGSPSGDALRQIPTCTTLMRNLDRATGAISAADGKDELRWDN